MKNVVRTQRTIEVPYESGVIRKYHRANVSFGVARYYYDYEF